MAAGSASLCALVSDRAQPLDQAIEFVERSKVYDEFTQFLHPAMAFDTFFYTHFDGDGYGEVLLAMGDGSGHAVAYVEYGRAAPIALSPAEARANTVDLGAGGARGGDPLAGDLDDIAFDHAQCAHRRLGQPGNAVAALLLTGGSDLQVMPSGLHGTLAKVQRPKRHSTGAPSRP